MSDAALPVQKAIFAALSSALSVPVLDSVAEDAPRQYVTIGDDTAVDYSTKTETGQDMTLTIHVWDSLYRGRAGVKVIQAQIYTALHRKALAVTGFDVEDVRFEFAETFLDADGLTYHGVCRYRVIVHG